MASQEEFERMMQQLVGPAMRGVGAVPPPVMDSLVRSNPNLTPPDMQRMMQQDQPSMQPRSDITPADLETMKRMMLGPQLTPQDKAMIEQLMGAPGNASAGAPGMPPVPAVGGPPMSEPPARLVFDPQLGRLVPSGGSTMMPPVPGNIGGAGASPMGWPGANQ